MKVNWTAGRRPAATVDVSALGHTLQPKSHLARSNFSPDVPKATDTMPLMTAISDLVRYSRRLSSRDFLSDASSGSGRCQFAASLAASHAKMTF
jgi:hypothetical protein